VPAAQPLHAPALPACWQRAHPFSQRRLQQLQLAPHLLRHGQAVQVPQQLVGPRRCRVLHLQQPALRRCLHVGVVDAYGKQAGKQLREVLCIADHGQPARQVDLEGGRQGGRQLGLVARLQPSLQ
jgi:hypothetical protein